MHHITPGDASKKITAVAFHLDGQYIALGFKSGPTLLWNLVDNQFGVSTHQAGWREEQVEEEESGICCFFSDNNRTKLALSLNSKTQVWNMSPGLDKADWLSMIPSGDSDPISFCSDGHTTIASSRSVEAALCGYR
jgi:WD40 repeat protein